jgi:hypothetical protein
MGNKFDEVRIAVRETEDQMAAADKLAEDIAWLLVGRLRKCNPYTLGRLKRELRDFNITTKEWTP